MESVEVLKAKRVQLKEQDDNCFTGEQILSMWCVEMTIMVSITSEPYVMNTVFG